MVSVELENLTRLVVQVEEEAAVVVGHRILVCNPPFHRCPFGSLCYPRDFASSYPHPGVSGVTLVKLTDAQGPYHYATAQQHFRLASRSLRSFTGFLVLLYFMPRWVLQSSDHLHLSWVFSLSNFQFGQHSEPRRRSCVVCWKREKDFSILFY